MRLLTPTISLRRSAVVTAIFDRKIIPFYVTRINPSSLMIPKRNCTPPAEHSRRWRNLVCHISKSTGYWASVFVLLTLSPSSSTMITPDGHPPIVCPTPPIPSLPFQIPQIYTQVKKKGVLFTVEGSLPPLNRNLICSRRYVGKTQPTSNRA